MCVTGAVRADAQFFSSLGLMSSQPEDLVGSIIVRASYMYIYVCLVYVDRIKLRHR